MSTRSSRRVGPLLTMLCGLAILLVVGCRRETSSPVSQPADASKGPATVNNADSVLSESAPSGIPPLPSATPAAAAEPHSGPVRKTQPEPVYRPNDTRPQHNRERARELGIGIYESRRLVLYTDIDPGIAATLPPLVDQLYEEWVDWFDKLPPARDGSEFQLTGYLMREQDRFIAAGMLPENLPYFPHGRHRGLEFWLNEQEFDYYRRHLLFHEATHCFMTALPGVHPPLWYLEGMAEFFGCHQFDAAGEIEFGVFPSRRENFIGFGRIDLLQEEVAAGRQLTLPQVGRLGQKEFAGFQPVPYGWSWCLCVFLDHHPRYHQRFRELARHREGRDFQRTLHKLYQPDEVLLAAEWNQFGAEMSYGFDFERMAFLLAAEPPAALSSEPHSVAVLADRGWQDSGVVLREGQTATPTAEGQILLAEQPQPWISEPQGVSIRYANGFPLGRLLVGFLPDREVLDLSEESIRNGRTQFFWTENLGREGTFTAPAEGRLFFRVNEFPNELGDNSGAYEVHIQAAE